MSIEQDSRPEHDHELELARLQAEHTAMVAHLRSSLEYRLGQAIADLRTRSGWRQFPRRMRSIIADARSRRRRPVPVATNHTPRRAARVAAVLDEFSMTCLQPEFTVVQPATDDTGHLDADLLLAETAWNGNAGAWAGEFSRYSDGGALARLVDRARASGVPSVLWNKEDPVNYQVFIAAARAFDAVVTTDADSVARYRHDLGHDRVGSMMFAAQPRVHHPLGRSLTERPTACFAGSWRGHKYPERVAQLTTLLDAANDLDALVIYDREPQSALRGDTFPERFHHAIFGRLDYATMLERYRSHHVFLNTNSVQDSPTMLSRRVFELLACGTPVVSTPSRAIETHLGDVVAMPTTAGEAHHVIERLLNDPEHRSRVGHLGYRLVHSHHTYEQRLNEMFGFLGLDQMVVRPPTVGVLVTATTADELTHLADQINDQLHRIDEIVVVVPIAETDLAERILGDGGRPTVVARAQSMTDGEALEVGRARCTADHVAIMVTDHHYAPNFLGDLMLARRFSDAAVVGKAAHFVQSASGLQLVAPEAEFTETAAIHPASALLDRRATAGFTLGVGTATEAVASLLARCARAEFPVISADRFNFVAPGEGARQSAPPHAAAQFPDGALL